MDTTPTTPSDILDNYFSKVGNMWLVLDPNVERRFSATGPMFTGNQIYDAIKNKEYTADQAIQSASDNIKKIFTQIESGNVEQTQQ